MYHSCLLIDVGTNPDRERPGRLWLRNLYRVHQRLAMAFPTDPRKEADKQFLKPYTPDDFPEDRPAIEVLDDRADIHEERSDEGGFLFRVDHGVERQEGKRSTVLLVQSAKCPDWEYAFGLSERDPDASDREPVGNAGCLLAAPPQTSWLEYVHPDPQSFRRRIWGLHAGEKDRPSRPPDTEFSAKTGSELHFRLNANPTRKLRNGPLKGKSVSVGRGPAAILDWLGRKGNEGGGFELVYKPDKTGSDPAWRIVTGLMQAWKKDGADEEAKPPMSFAYAMIDGVLKVTDPVLFAKTLQKGVGRAKAFGFGLLSVTSVASV